MTGREIINAIVYFFWDIFFLVRVSIFQSKEMEIEFKELVNEIIPSLNECVNCNIFECKCCYNFTVNCSSCRKLKCKNCEKY